MSEKIKALTMTEYQVLASLEEMSETQPFTQSVILGNINYERERAGIEPLAIGTVISCMPVLEEKGLVEEVTGKQKRKEYGLTKEGFKCLFAHYDLFAVNNPDWSDD